MGRWEMDRGLKISFIAKNAQSKSKTTIRSICLYVRTAAKSITRSCCCNGSITSLILVSFMDQEQG